MALGEGEGRVLGEPAEEGQAHSLEGLLQDPRVALRAHPVGQDPHHPHPGVEVAEAQGEGGDGARHPLGVHHQGDRGL